MIRTAKPVFKFKNYPFNWTEFHAWAKAQPKRYSGNGKQTVFKIARKNEIQNTQSNLGCDIDLHGLPVWPCIRVPSDKRIGKPRTSGTGSVCIAGIVGALMINPAFAQVQIAEPVTVDFSVTVVSMASASNDDQLAAMGCKLNKETNVVEC